MSNTAAELFRSARLACWYSAWAAGACSLDDARDAVVGADAAHDVLGLRDEPVPLVLALGMLRATGAGVATLALPAPGDLTGLGGPPEFNADALEASEAVLLPSSGLGLVPTAVGAGVTWQVSPAHESHTVPDLVEADTALRETLLESSARLADLDVPRWRPEAAEGLQALRHPAGEPLPAGYGVRAQRAAALALPERFLLTVATLEPRKGLDVLIAALGTPGAPDLPLLCAGQPGWGGQDPLALAAAAGLPPGRVRLLGRVSDPDLAVLLRRATALVVPSRAEGFGLPLLEAMAVGTPVVTSDAPALVEVGGGAARVSALDPSALARALAEVAHDEALRVRMAAAGRVRAGAYSWDSAARRLWTAARGVRAGEG